MLGNPLMTSGEKDVDWSVEKKKKRKNSNEVNTSLVAKLF